MTKLLKNVVLAMALMPFISCDKDDDKSDPGPDPSTLVLVKKMISTADNETFTREFTYDGKKIVSMADSDGTKMNFTYTGDLITKIEEKDKDGVLKVTRVYTYTAEGKSATSSEKTEGQQYTYKLVYTYNADGTISYEEFMIDNETGDEDDGARVGKYTFSGNNLVKYEYTYYGAPYSHTFEYDSKNNPFKNITGFSKLLNWEEDISVNNIVKETSISGSHNPSLTTNEYTSYDANGFPTMVKSFFNGKLGETITYTY